MFREVYVPVYTAGLYTGDNHFRKERRKRHWSSLLLAILVAQVEKLVCCVCACVCWTITF